MASREQANHLIAPIYRSVNLQPLIKIPKTDKQHPNPKKGKFRVNVTLATQEVM
jgi:hypothetical protein